MDLHGGEELTRAQRGAGRLVLEIHQRSLGDEVELQSTELGLISGEDSVAIDFSEHPDHLNPEDDIYSTATCLHTSFRYLRQQRQRGN
jgi:hypothetical protein